MRSRIWPSRPATADRSCSFVAAKLSPLGDKRPNLSASVSSAATFLRKKRDAFFKVLNPLAQQPFVDGALVAPSRLTECLANVVEDGLKV